MGLSTLSLINNGSLTLIAFVGWIILWFGIFGIFNGLFKPNEVTYLKQGSKTVFLFLSASIIPTIYLIHSGETFKLGLLLITAFAIELIATLFRLSFIQIKLSDVLFQQLMILSLYTILPIESFHFGLLFGILHTPILFINNLKYKYIYFISAFFGGSIFATLYEIHVWAIPFALLIHSGYYILLEKLIPEIAE